MTNLVELQTKIADLQKQADAIKSKEFASTVADIRAKMAAFGITVRDLQTTTGKKRGRKAKGDPAPKAAKAPKKTGARAQVAAKFNGPNGEAWSGRGLTPKWLSALVASGRSKEEFAVKAQASQAA